MSKKSIQNTSVAVLLVACIVAALTMVISLIATNDSEKVQFTAPPFEENAVIGEPQVAQELGYSLFSQDDIPYSFSVCGRVTTHDTKAIVYFTNPKDNDCWLRLRVLDEKGSILGQTGILRSDEYVEGVVLSRPLSKGTKITLKIMGYEPDTYYSVGAIQINTTIGE